MWIRSQDKEKLLDCYEFEYRSEHTDRSRTDVSHFEDYEAIFDNMKGLLGGYKTKKRCLEVLDDIGLAITNMKRYPESSPILYQMPKE